jgi:protein-S-isoprenylcysteine O-methyltransferase Ste14
MRLFAVIRSAIYMTAFVSLWAWLALTLRRFDPRLGVAIPDWCRPIGLGLMVLGAALGLLCGLVFSTRGRGTPAPFDPPREFVASGPYRYVRNPMYVGGLTLLLGFGLYLQSLSIIVLAIGFALLAHLFVILVEEPGLEHRFGDSYRCYKQSVHRWLPGFPPGGAGVPSPRSHPT